MNQDDETPLIGAIGLAIAVVAALYGVSIFDEPRPTRDGKLFLVCVAVCFGVGLAWREVLGLILAGFALTTMHGYMRELSLLRRIAFCLNLGSAVAHFPSFDPKDMPKWPMWVRLEPAELRIERLDAERDARVRALEDIGFVRAGAFVVPDVPGDLYVIALLNRNENAVGFVSEPARIGSWYDIAARLESGMWLVVSNEPIHDGTHPPNVRHVRDVGATPEELWSRFLEERGDERAHPVTRTELRATLQEALDEDYRFRRAQLSATRASRAWCAGDLFPRLPRWPRRA